VHHVYTTIHTATHCNTLQHTATRRNTLQQVRETKEEIHIMLTLQYTLQTHYNIPQHTATGAGDRGGNAHHVDGNGPHERGPFRQIGPTLRRFQTSLPQ